MTERRARERRAEPRGVERRRGPGRPTLSAEERANRQTLHVVLPKSIHDAVCRLARRHDISDNAAARRLIALALKARGDDGLLLSK